VSAEEIEALGSWLISICWKEPSDVTIVKLHLETFPLTQIDVKLHELHELVKQQTQNLQPKLNIDRKLIFVKFSSQISSRGCGKKNNTYKQDLCSSESFCAIRPTIGIQIFKCLLVILVISSPFNLIKYSVPASSATPRTSWHSDQVPVVNVAWLPADTWNKIRNNSETKCNDVQTWERLIPPNPFCV